MSTAKPRDREPLRALPKKKQAEWKDEQLPYDGATEAAVLGSLMGADRTVAVRALPYFAEDLFCDPTHRVIFAAIATVLLRGEAATVTNVAHQLVSEGVLDEIGGSRALRDLEANSEPIRPLETARYLDHYRLQRLVIEWKLAPLAGSGHETVAQLRAMLRTAERELRPLAHTAPQVMQEVYDGLQSEEDANLVPTGLYSLDEKVGLCIRGCVTVVKARSGLGKSAFAWAVLRAIAAKGTRGLIHSMEMYRDEVGRRGLADRMTVENWRVQRNRLRWEEREALQGACLAESELPWLIRDEDAPWPQHLGAYESLCLQYPDLGIIVIDYVQLLRQPETRRMREETRASFLDQVGREVKELARRQRIAVLMLAQMQDEGMIRESRGILHSADTVVELEISQLRKKNGKVDPTATWDKDEPCLLEVDVQKGRNMRAGMVQIEYDPRYQRIGDLPGARPPSLEEQRELAAG